MPSFFQFAMWWQQTMGPLFSQFADNAKNAHSPLKELLDILGNIIIFIAKVGMIVVEYVLPIFVNAIGFILTLLKPLLDFWLNFTGWLSTTGVDIIKEAFVVISGIITGLWTTVQNVFGWIGGKINDASKEWKQAFNGFGQFLSGIWNGVSQGVAGMLNWIISQFNNVIGAVDSISINTPFGHVGFNIPLIPLISSASTSASAQMGSVGLAGTGASLPSLATGGEIPPGGSAYVHAKELLVSGGSTGLSVFNRNQTAGMLGGGNGGHVYNTNTFNIMLPPGSPRQQAEALVDEMAKALARKWRGNATIQDARSGSVRS